MTDNDIIKALECVVSGDVYCIDCKYHTDLIPRCKRQAAKDAIDIINRQKAEIERLTARNFELSEKGEKVCIAYKNAKAEAIKGVAHGYWYDRGSLSCRCSECGCKNIKETKYCPHCGAKMDGEAKEDVPEIKDGNSWKARMIRTFIGEENQ